MNTAKIRTLGCWLGVLLLLGVTWGRVEGERTGRYTGASRASEAVTLSVGEEGEVRARATLLVTLSYSDDTPTRTEPFPPFDLTVRYRVEAIPDRPEQRRVVLTPIDLTVSDEPGRELIASLRPEAFVRELVVDRYGCPVTAPTPLPQAPILQSGEVLFAVMTGLEPTLFCRPPNAGTRWTVTNDAADVRETRRYRLVRSDDGPTAELDLSQTTHDSTRSDLTGTLGLESGTLLVATREL
ncbi:MAG: hypothetical protein U5L04_08455 [Trueperaceae bacterium]|nr:hypothetical protein [Trueperaceae bacterium]